LPLAFTLPPAAAQSVEAARSGHPVIVQAIDERSRITLEGNTRPEANSSNDRGAQIFQSAGRQSCQGNNFRRSSHWLH
jgi:hypothetical protein